MQRSYYSESIIDFIQTPCEHILGILTQYHSFALEGQQKMAWQEQIRILQRELQDIKQGYIFFEFAIPRMGKRVDVAIVSGAHIFVLEFKVGASTFTHEARTQVIDYVLDLKNFHEGSHNSSLVPILVATKSTLAPHTLFEVVQINEHQIGDFLVQYLLNNKGKPIDCQKWAKSSYKPTPTIIEAAQALYKGHKVDEISRSDAGAINLTKTSNILYKIINNAKKNKTKCICFVTGVPGAGKTLAGLNIATQRMKSEKDEHAVFLSGNGPLVNVLREALARDTVRNKKLQGKKCTKADEARHTQTFIQNIHHFRDDNIQKEKAPIEKVVVFDEAQRAWDKKQATKFMKEKRDLANFNASEPHFLIETMNRHKDWCVIICLVGGGQEINTGEAGIEEWIEALNEDFSNWKSYYSPAIINTPNYVRDSSIQKWISQNGIKKTDLHLSVSIRSFRTEKLAEFIEALLNKNTERAVILYKEISNSYPIVITRSLETAKEWVRKKAKGSERYGIIASSKARRLRADGIDVKNEIKASHWFLNGHNDVRSSFFMEDVATEFDIQGLEIDWSCFAWGGDLSMKDNEWVFRSFKGTKWQSISKKSARRYLLNTYRVLLTRARQGMVWYITKGSDLDLTRPKEDYNGIYTYLKHIGIIEI